MRKRGQGVFGISFGVIFSIIIIIAIIAVSFYAIRYFLGLNNCAQTGLFYDDLQDQIDRARASGVYRETYTGAKLPSGIENICFGNINAQARGGYYPELQNQLADFDPPNTANIFLYPADKACDGDLFANKLENVELNNDFYCANITSGNPEITLEFNDREHDSVRINN